MIGCKRMVFQRLGYGNTGYNNSLKKKKIVHFFKFVSKSGASTVITDNHTFKHTHHPFFSNDVCDRYADHWLFAL